MHAGPGLKKRWRPPRTPVPGNPGPPHPNPATLHALVAAQFPRLDAVPAKDRFQKVGPRKLQGVIVPASAWGFIFRVPDFL